MPYGGPQEGRLTVVISHSKRQGFRSAVSMSLAVGALLATTVGVSAQMGSWSIVASPNTSTVQNNFLSGVTCVSSSDCWSVGDYTFPSSGIPPETDQTLIDHYDGTSWSIVSSPNIPATTRDYLTSVTCPASNDCWAVGWYFTAVGAQTLIEHYDGAVWSIVSSPNDNTSQSDFVQGVSCVNSTDCWAVGWSANLLSSKTLIEHYDGSGWTIVPSPNGGSVAGGDSLAAVACVGASDCWAVGSGVMLHYDGVSWTSAPISFAVSISTFFGVACSGTSECWAVGTQYAGQLGYQTLVGRWDGAAWSIVSSPNAPASNYNSLRSVTCAGSTECWAVGQYFGPVIGEAPIAQTLIEKFDGAGWSISPSPNTSASQTNYLEGVNCVSGTDCWAVGSSTNPSNLQTLIEQFTGSALAPPLFTADTPPTSAMQGQPFSYRFSASGNPPPTFAVAAGFLPTGLQLDSATGQLSGTPTSSGSFVFSVGASNGVAPAAVTPPISITVTPAIAEADIEVSLTGPQTTDRGDAITYSLTVDDLGPSPASNVRVHFTLPKGTDFISATPHGKWDRDHDRLDWTLSRLDPAVRATFTIEVTVEKRGSVIASARAHSSTSDPNLHNNSAFLVTHVWSRSAPW